MESIIFSVKMLFSTHGLLDSKTFNIGLLKPKDIHGNTVDVSQRAVIRRNSYKAKDSEDNSGDSTNSDGDGRRRRRRNGSQNVLRTVKIERNYSNNDNGGEEEEEEGNEDRYGDNRETDEENSVGDDDETESESEENEDDEEGYNDDD